MAISTLAELKSSITNWSKRDDLSSYHDDIILTAEKWIFRRARTRDMETALSVTLSSGLGTVPSDFLALKYAYIDGTPTRPLQPKAAGWILKNYPTRSSTSKPNFIGIDAGNFMFGPFPDSDYTLKGTYYAKPDSILSAVDTFFTNNPDLYLWASLAELEPFLKNDKRIEVWAAKRDQVLGDLLSQERAAEFSGGPLVMHADVQYA